MAYNFDTKLNVPLRLYWATIFAGRDLNVAGENMYSTFVSAEYSVYRNEHWIVDVGLGGTLRSTGTISTAMRISTGMTESTRFRCARPTS